MWLASTRQRKRFWSRRGNRSGTGIRKRASRWETSTAARNADGSSAIINNLISSSDGKHIAASDTAGRVFVWNAEKTQPAYARVHSGPVNGLAFTPDGQRLISVSDDKTARVWNTEDGKELKKFAHDGPVYALAVSADGKQILTGGAEKIIRLWQLQEDLKIEVPPTKKPDPEVGFVPIFNGKDLDGWEAKTRPEAFAVDPDGHLTARGDTPAGRQHWLLTKKEYTDYVLRLRCPVHGCGGQPTAVSRSGRRRTAPRLTRRD